MSIPTMLTLTLTLTSPAEGGGVTSSSPQSQGGRHTKPKAHRAKELYMDIKGVGYGHKGGTLWATRGSILGMHGDDSTIETIWPCWALSLLGSSTRLCCVDYTQQRWGFSSYARMS